MKSEFLLTARISNHYETKSTVGKRVPAKSHGGIVPSSYTKKLHMKQNVSPGVRLWYRILLCESKATCPRDVQTSTSSSPPLASDFLFVLCHQHNPPRRRMHERCWWSSFLPWQRDETAIKTKRAAVKTNTNTLQNCTVIIGLH